MPGSDPTPDWVVEDTFSVFSSEHVIRLDVFSGTCPEKVILAEGAATGAVIEEVLADDLIGVPITVQGLHEEEYCFTATMVNSSCEVVGFGATPADLSHHKHITTAINEAVDPPRGGCETGLVCQSGFCVSED